MSRNPIRIAAAIIALLGATPIDARAQASPATASEANPPSKLWLVLGGTSTTLRGDCQEDCVAHGTGGLVRVRGLDHGPALGLQRAFQEAADGRLVVDDQDRGGAVGHASGPVLRS